MTAGSLTGTTALARLALRRDRIMLPAWLYVVIIGVCANAYTFVKLYKTPSSRAALVASGQDNPALLFLYGRLNGTSTGALTAWRYGVWGALIAVLMTVFLVIRHTRADEEAGRLELIGSARVRRQAPLMSALAVAALANAVLVVVLCLALPLLGLPAAGSAALSLAIGTCGLAWAGISAVAAQLTSGARAARGLALGVLGVAFLARAVGDSAGAGGPGWLTWVLPLGWTEEVRPFADERWWVLALPVALFVIGVCLAFVLAARRDYGAGLLPDRPGRPSASALLRGPFSLAWRLQWGSLAGWAASYAVLFAVCGAAAKGIGQLFGTSSALEKEFTRLGGQSGLVNAYLASLMLLAGLVAAGYAVSTVLRLRAEETEGRADPVLAGTTGRGRWGLSHLLVAVVGTAVLLAIAGVATGLGYGLRAGGTGGEVARMLGAGMAELPAALLIAAIAVAVFGLLPQASVAVSWTVVGIAVALNIFGQVLQVSHWVLDISPFAHVPRLPGGTVSASPLLWLSALAVAFAAAGLAGLQRRDIGLAPEPPFRAPEFPCCARDAAASRRIREFPDFFDAARGRASLLVPGNSPADMCATLPVNVVARSGDLQHDHGWGSLVMCFRVSLPGPVTSREKREERNETISHASARRNGGHTGLAVGVPMTAGVASAATARSATPAAASASAPGTLTSTVTGTFTNAAGPGTFTGTFTPKKFHVVRGRGRGTGGDV